MSKDKLNKYKMYDQTIQQRVNNGEGGQELYFLARFVRLCCMLIYAWSADI